MLPANLDSRHPFRTALVLISVSAFPGLIADPGQVLRHRKIGTDPVRFPHFLDPYDGFGAALAPLGDLDGDAVVDLAVGAPGDDDGGNDRGAVGILFLERDRSVKSYQKISSRAGGLHELLRAEDPLSARGEFGGSLAAMGDQDGDGIPDLAVGAPMDGSLGMEQGAVWLLFLRRDGTVR